MSIDLDGIERRIADGIYGDDRMTKEGRNDAFSALNEIIAEVERLRAEVKAERAAVVAWLRERQPGWPAGSGGHADAIERGAHRREEDK